MPRDVPERNRAAPSPAYDPQCYALEFQDRVQDLPFYVELAARAPGRVLELGCGTGRLVEPMALRGAHVVAVDHDPAMLAVLRTRIDELEDVRVDIVRGSLDEVGPIGAVGMAAIAFNTLLHLPDLEAVTRCLRGLRKRLVKGGWLALDVYVRAPGFGELFDGSVRGTRVDPATGEEVTSLTWARWNEASSTQTVSFLWTFADGTVRRARYDQRVWSREELVGAITAAGLRVTWEAADFEETPWGPDSLTWVAILAP